MKEELGLDVVSSELSFISEFSDSKYDTRKLELYFITEVKGEIQFNDPCNEVFYAEYFDKEELNKIKVYPEQLKSLDNKKVFLGTFSR